MQLGDLAAGDLTLPAGTGAIDIAGLSADSRAIERGFLFGALPGTRVDGARFAPQAVERGAVAVLAGADASLDLPDDIAVLRADDPRRVWARFAARFYPRQPQTMVAVTGTSGKTSVAEFVRQIFAAAGRRSASVGTLGVVAGDASRYGSLTTPETVALHADLDKLARGGVTHAAMEASSHGLDQRRLDGVRLVAAGYTNLGRDHMDYHRDEAEYLSAKIGLFERILPADGVAVVNADDSHAAEVIAAANARGQRVMTVGASGSDICVRSVTPDGFGQQVAAEAFGVERNFLLPLAGTFQVANAVMAAGLAIAAGESEEKAFGALTNLKGAPGRLELAGRKPNGAMVFIDYAHKPDALTHALGALRPMTAGRLVVVFGAGGDRDPGKRALMGKAASAAADMVIVTDDNPRSEDPAAIRRAILQSAPAAREIGDRASAIAAAIDLLEPDDVLCVAGKGHETGQIIGEEVVPFSDHEAVRAALSGEAA